ncbi:MAG: redoxin family protein [Acidobacteriia bacterium]|nr:redoxin family protein [Terriglobia bacterium]
MLSDSALAFTGALRLPVFEVEGMILIKRVTMILNTGKIIKMFYPVFPPDQNAREVAEWLLLNGKGATGKRS